MRALVTGGGGFVGRAIVEELLTAGHDVTSAGRAPRPELEALGARHVCMDLGQRESVAGAVAGHDGVVHAAALTGVWGPHAAYERTNVLGTHHVIEACRAHGVTRLVHTSSPSVCFDGADHLMASNDLPYASRFLSPYPESKARAEREVLAANGSHGLATCALRPHLVIGPRDPHLVPRLVARARAGRLFTVGGGDNEVSMTWVGNAALAHRLALEQLTPDAPHAGRAYFVAQRDPVRLWDWIEDLLGRLGEPPPRGRLPRGLAAAAGAALEGVWWALHLRGEPPMTRFVAAQLAASHSYDVAPLERDLGYRERVSMAEATDLLVESLRGAQ